MAIAPTERETDLPSVSIVISELNSKRTLERCLGSVLAQNYPSDRFEVIVVDGGSTDGSIELLERVKAPNLRTEVVPGCSETRGQIAALALATGSIIMFTNSDVYVPADWVQRHVAWHSAAYDLVGGSVFWGGDKYALPWNLPPSQRTLHALAPGQGLGFNNCSVARTVLDRSGGLREIISQQDVDFTFRVLEGGGRLVLDPSITVYHDHPLRSLPGSIRRAYGFAKNHILLLRLHDTRAGGASQFISVVDFLAGTANELLLVAGVRAFRRAAVVARDYDIRVGVLEFLWIRGLTMGIARNAGMAAGFLRRRESLGTLVNMHLEQRNAIPAGPKDVVTQP